MSFYNQNEGVSDGTRENESPRRHFEFSKVGIDSLANPQTLEEVEFKNLLVKNLFNLKARTLLAATTESLSSISISRPQSPDSSFHRNERDQPQTREVNNNDLFDSERCVQTRTNSNPVDRRCPSTPTNSANADASGHPVDYSQSSTRKKTTSGSRPSFFGISQPDPFPHFRQFPHDFLRPQNRRSPQKIEIGFPNSESLVSSYNRSGLISRNYKRSEANEFRNSELGNDELRNSKFRSNRRENNELRSGGFGSNRRENKELRSGRLGSNELENNGLRNEAFGSNGREDNGLRSSEFGSSGLETNKLETNKLETNGSRNNRLGCRGFTKSKPSGESETIDTEAAKAKDSEWEMNRSDTDENMETGIPNENEGESPSERDSDVSSSSFTEAVQTKEKLQERSSFNRNLLSTAAAVGSPFPSATVTAAASPSLGASPVGDALGSVLRGSRMPQPLIPPSPLLEGLPLPNGYDGHSLADVASGTSEIIARALVAARGPRKPRGEKKPIPNDLKDIRYYERRKRNNIAAKKSRDARKQRENEIARKASLLETENNYLKRELMALKVQFEILANDLIKKGFPLFNLFNLSNLSNLNKDFSDEN